MIHTLTFVLIIMCFIVTTFICEKHFIKNPPQFGFIKVIFSNIIIEFILLSSVVIVPNLFPILIYGSVILACYVCSYSRNRRIGQLKD